MTQFKFVGFVALLSLSALSMAQDKVKIEPKWDKDSKAKYTLKGNFEVGGHKVDLSATTAWTAEVSDKDYTLHIHSDDLSVMADGNDVNPPSDDYKIGLDKQGGLKSVEGGIQGADGVRMFVITHFFVPTGELTKDAASKWEVAKNEKMEMAALAIETTYLGQEEIGKNKVYKFKQTVKETGTSFTTEGTFFVTKDGHVVRAESKFGGLSIPAVGAEAAGSFKLNLND